MGAAQAAAVAAFAGSRRKQRDDVVPPLRPLPLQAYATSGLEANLWLAQANRLPHSTTRGRSE